MLILLFVDENETPDGMVTEEYLSWERTAGGLTGVERDWLSVKWRRPSLKKERWINTVCKSDYFKAQIRLQYPILPFYEFQDSLKSMCIYFPCHCVYTSSCPCVYISLYIEGGWKRNMGEKYQTVCMYDLWKTHLT